MAAPIGYYRRGIDGRGDDTDPRAPALIDDPHARRRVVRTAIRDVAVAALTVAAYYLIPWSGGRGGILALRIALVVVLLTVAVGVAIRVVATSDHPVQRAIEALVAIVVLTILAFASIYLIMSNSDETAFSEQLGHTSALYFSMTTATTIGFGDISARTDATRIVVMLQMVVNVAAVGTAVRLIVRTAQRRVAPSR